MRLVLAFPGGRPPRRKILAWTGGGHRRIGNDNAGMDQKALHPLSILCTYTEGAAGSRCGLIPAMNLQIARKISEGPCSNAFWEDTHTLAAPEGHDNFACKPC